MSAATCSPAEKAIRRKKKLVCGVVCQAIQICVQQERRAGALYTLPPSSNVWPITSSVVAVVQAGNAEKTPYRDVFCSSSVSARPRSLLTANPAYYATSHNPRGSATSLRGRTALKLIVPYLWRHPWPLPSIMSATIAPCMPRDAGRGCERCSCGAPAAAALPLRHPTPYKEP